MVRLLLIASVLFANTAFAQQRITKTFPVGSLAYLESSEPVGWLCFDREIASERDGARCYIPTRAGTFQVAALSKSQVGEVLAIFKVTIGGSPDVDPSPEPSPPAPTPPIPNTLGLGGLAFEFAPANQRDTVSQLASMWRNVAATFQAMDEVSVSQMQSMAKRIDSQFTAITKATPEWMTWTQKVHQKINDLQTASNGWTGQDWITAAQEIAAALEIAKDKR